ncbi:MAG: YciI family protein, partial [Rhodothermales bacterium]
FRAGDELADGGWVLVQEEGQVIGRTFTMPSDGIGGYFIIAARDYDEAIALASRCPQLDYGGSVELRQLVRR